MFQNIGAVFILDYIWVVASLNSSFSFSFSAECARQTPISRYYLYGSPFTCMIASQLFCLYFHVMLISFLLCVTDYNDYCVLQASIFVII